VKQNVSPGIFAAIIVVVLAVIGVVAYRTFFGNPYATPLQGDANMKAFQEMQARSAIHQHMNEGGGRGAHQ
jgi:hypothetical protein